MSKTQRFNKIWRSITPFALLLVLLPIPANALDPSKKNYDYNLYSNTYNSLQWGNQAIEVNRAPKPKNLKNLIVAVVDTGIDGTHPYLEGRVGGGWDFVNNKEIAPGTNSDDEGHGTHVAGIIGADGDLKGVAPGAQFMPVKVLDSGGGGDDNTVSKGVDYAVDNGARVINLSLGGRMDAFGKPDSKTCKSITRAFKKGVGVIVAAGNSGSSGDALSNLSKCEGSFNVGAVDEQLRRSYFSNFDSSVNIVAPGSNILSTVASGDRLPYASWSGTSMATPFVTGAYLLKLSHGVESSPAQIYKTLMQSAIDIGPKGKDPQFGYGLLNIPRLLGGKASSLQSIKGAITSKLPTQIKSAVINDKGTTFEISAPVGVSLKRVDLVVIRNGFSKVKSESKECQSLYDSLYQTFSQHPNGNEYTNEMVRKDIKEEGNIYKTINEDLPRVCSASEVNKFMLTSFMPYSVSTSPEISTEKSSLKPLNNRLTLSKALNFGALVFLTGYDSKGNAYQALPFYDFTDERSRPKEEVNKITELNSRWVDGLLKVEYKTQKNAPVSISIADYQSGFFKFITSNSSPFILNEEESKKISAHPVTIYLSTSSDSTQSTLLPVYGFDYQLLTAGLNSILIKGKSTLCNYNKIGCTGDVVELVTSSGNTIAKSIILDNLSYFFNIDNLDSFEGFIRSGENRSEVIKWSR